MMMVPVCNCRHDCSMLHSFSFSPDMLKLLWLLDAGMLNGPVSALAKKNPGLKHLVLDECDGIEGNGLKVTNNNKETYILGGDFLYLFSYKILLCYVFEKYI